MFRLRMIAAALCAVWLTACTHAVPSPSLAPAEAKAFGPLAALTGKTFRSEGDGGASDIAQWSADLGGRVLVNRHALVDGSYGGVTYVYRNAKTGSLDYVYATSAGFHTSGTFTLNPDGSWTSEEAVTGHATITRVRATGRIDAEGRLLSVSEYLQSGAWVPGRNVIYTPYDGPVPEVKRAAE
jgi:hypothetical protein